jgi:hypothetical protein
VPEGAMIKETGGQNISTEAKKRNEIFNDQTTRG